MSTIYTTKVSIGDPTKATAYNHLIDNDIYLKNYLSIKSTSINYTILDDDGYSVILVTTGASDKTITLPTVADNNERQLKIVKIDDGAGKVIVDAEGAETINGTTIWEITEQYGYVEFVSNASAWFVIGQQGCIYEMWDATLYSLTTSWVDYYNLSGLIAGKYFIEFGVSLKVVFESANWVHATIATTVDTEDDQKYTVSIYTGNNQSDGAFLTKSFYRSFSSATTLYLNAKEQIGGGTIRSTGSNAKGYIRAIRIG